MVSLGDEQPARGTLRKRSVCVPSSLLASDAGTNRYGHVLRAKLDAAGPDYCCNAGSPGNFDRTLRMIQSWLVPPIVIPILISVSLLGYVVLLAFS